MPTFSPIVNLSHMLAGGMGTGTLAGQGASGGGYTRMCVRHMPWFMPGATLQRKAATSRKVGWQW